MPEQNVLLLIQVGLIIKKANIGKQGYYYVPTRGVKSLTLSPKSPSSPKSYTIAKQDASSSSPNDETMDTAIKFVHENPIGQQLTLRAKRSFDQISNPGSSEINTLSKKAKIYHENETISDSRILGEVPSSSTVVETGSSSATVVETGSSSATVAETGSSGAPVVESLASKLETYKEMKLQATHTMNEIESAISMIDMYISRLSLQVTEVIASRYAVVRERFDLALTDLSPPRLFRGISPDSDSNSDSSSSDIGAFTNRGEGMESLDNPFSSNFTYSDLARTDQVIYNNYNINMQGIDNADYRMAYEYLKDCLNHLDDLMVQEQAMVAHEHSITSLDVAFQADSSIVASEITAILDLLSNIIG